MKTFLLNPFQKISVLTCFSVSLQRTSGIFIFRSDKWVMQNNPRNDQLVLVKSFYFLWHLMKK